MLLPAPPLYPRRRKAKPKRQAPAPAVAPLLVAASFDAGDPLVTLVFDRAVTQEGAMAASAVIVRDGDNVYDSASVVTQIDPVTLTVGMVLMDVQPGSGTTLTATAATGIVGASGGIAWAGVSGVALPFP